MNAQLTLETQIAHSVVDALLAAGYSVGINDGEETIVSRSLDREEIFAAMRTSDEDYVFAYTPDVKGAFG